MEAEEEMQPSGSSGTLAHRLQIKEWGLWGRYVWPDGTPPGTGAPQEKSLYTTVNPSPGQHTSVPLALASSPNTHFRGHSSSRQRLVELEIF